ncbi:MAG TPA: carboxypeptidase-like regulatory domain-containing protein, partial [Bryobacteraceae bacterium]|nr:carboxypeptidase-like regulatory domain-containing protein [Bryobacteraceae bacterium]
MAQTDAGRIAGNITDLNGAAVPNARVVVKNDSTGAERSTVTNDRGDYIVSNLLPAVYTITASSSGLGPTEYTEIHLGVGQARTLNIVLKPAALQQEVTVSGGELAVVDMSSARIGVNVSSREVSNLPLNGRQLSQLYLMAPGAVNVGSGTFDDIRFSGRSNQENALRFDGVEGSSIVD